MFSKLYPALADWADDWGWLEIGSDEESSSLVRVLDEGGMVWESPEKLQNLDRALQLAEAAVADFMETNA